VVAAGLSLRNQDLRNLKVAATSGNGDINVGEPLVGSRKTGGDKPLPYKNLQT
jgi:hypothetical protein